MAKSVFRLWARPTHLWAALAYVERNPVRAGIVATAAQYQWSSASAHPGGSDASGLLDREWWQREAPGNWGERLARDDGEAVTALRGCTYAGRPFGSEEFVRAMGEKFDRHRIPARPRNEKAASVCPEPTQQLTFF